MPTSKIKLSEGEVSQTIDLKELFGTSFVGNEQLAQSVAQAMIDRIVSRTESGKDINGKAFKKYSKEYKDSLEFKAFGKTGDVNLKLTGQMLGTLDVLETSGSKVKIGWNDGSESAKAYNHNVGDTLPKRQFFGLTDSELDSIKKEFASQVQEETQGLRDERALLLRDILRVLNNNDQIEVDNG
jgi:hypothetical protein